MKAVVAHNASQELFHRNSEDFPLSNVDEGREEKFFIV